MIKFFAVFLVTMGSLFAQSEEPLLFLDANVADPILDSVPESEFKTDLANEPTPCSDPVNIVAPGCSAVIAPAPSSEQPTTLENPCAPCSDVVKRDPCAPGNHIQAGVNYTWLNITPEGLNSTTGSLGGLQAMYEYRLPETIYAGVAFSWRQGNTTGAQGSERSFCYIDLQERIGYSFEPICSRWNCSLFTGFGYRHHGEDVSEFTGASSVTFDYNQLYIPVGLIFDGKINRILTMGINFEWMPQVYPTVKISPLDGARWILDTELGNIRLGIPLTITPWEKKDWFFVVEPFFEYWQDGATTAVTPAGLALAIPKNNYYFAGFNVNAGYSF